MDVDVKAPRKPRFIRRLLRNERGQSLTEMALLLPLLLLLLCGMMDFGRLLYAHLRLNLATQETVRLGGLGKTDAEITVFARDYIQLGTGSALTVQIAPTQATRRSGHYVTVTLQHPQPFMTPIIGRLFPSPVVTASSTIRVE